MSERAHPRLVLVLAAPGHAGTAVMGALSGLGVPAPPPAVRLRIDDVVLAASGACPAGVGSGVSTSTDCVAPDLDDAVARLRKQAAEPMPAPVLAWHHAAAPQHVACLLDALPAAGWEPAALLVWDAPEAAAANADGATRAAALASWESTYHDALRQLEGRPCAVAPVGAPARLTAVLKDVVGIGGREASAPSGEPGAAAAAADPDVLPGQLRLAEVLHALTGVHRALPALPLPGISAWAMALRDAERRARLAAAETAEAWTYAHERAEDANVLWRALWQTGAELADAVARDVRRGGAPADEAVS